MATRTMNQLIEDVRFRGEYDVNYIPDVDLTNFLNMSIARAEEIGKQTDTSRFVATTAIVTVAGTASYALAGAQNVLDLTLNNQVLNRTNWADRLGPSADAYGYDYFNFGRESKYEYNFRNGSVYLYPTPTDVDTIAVTYTPEVTTISGTQTWTAPVEWHQFVVYDALVQCALKAEDSPAPFQAQVDRMEALMRNARTDIGDTSHIGRSRRRRRY